MKPYEPKDFMDTILGKDVWDMSELIDEKFPEGSPENDIIERGQSWIVKLFTILGFIAGVLFILSILLSFYIVILIAGRY